MKKDIVIALSALLLFAGAAVTALSLTKERHSFFNENLEALMDAETLFDLCDTYCSNMSGYVCVLHTSAGYDIYCDEMRASWSN
jgi:hypothetical protein